jgi:hypothetical protein
VTQAQLWIRSTLEKILRYLELVVFLGSIVCGVSVVVQKINLGPSVE